VTQRYKTYIFLSSRMGEIGTEFDNYRRALKKFIEGKYPFLQVECFEYTTEAKNYKKSELDDIEKSSIILGIIFEDSDEVIYEIERAIGFKNIVFLIFYPDENKSPKTWDKFAKKLGDKCAKANNWDMLLDKIEDSLNKLISRMLDETRNKIDYSPPKTEEPLP